MLHVLVLGSAAGGGFPQWNGNDAAARRARAGDPRLPPRAQSSLAVSADGKRWVLLNASPDLRQQIGERRQLQPGPDDPKRASPIAAVVLTNADVDHVAGLLTLRENHAFVIYAHRRVIEVLGENRIFDVLSRERVCRRNLPVGEKTELRDAAGQSLDIWLEPFAVPGKAPLWREDRSLPSWGTQEGDAVGLALGSGGGVISLYYVPGCAALGEDLARRLEGAPVVLFDGTLWRDDEMIVQGVGAKTGRRMGHMSCAGEDGSMAAFEKLGVRRKVYVHINNTNPVLDPDSPERAEAESRGWEIAWDGMEILL
ncbi:MAG TPA: pyrroloquinoline quinone biosynthesis protein PqqB [Rhizomicrobium sp.]|jgi:pyrroloquinoline quinone biosynthesis protein B